MSDVKLDFSGPGKPTDNVFVESFNGKFRAECLKIRLGFCRGLRNRQKVRVGGETTTRSDRTVPSATGPRRS